MKHLAVAADILAGCASPATSPSPASPAEGLRSSAPATSPSVVPKPLSLSGKWKQSNSKAEDAWQAITIKKGVIQIWWVSDGGDTRSVYWVGSYVNPKASEDAYEWTSKRDKKKTDSALLASTARTKKFTYANGVLSYEVTMLGTTTTVKAQRI